MPVFCRSVCYNKTKMPTHALLIVNPVAGQSRLRGPLPALEDALAPLVHRVCVTQGPGDARNAARQARANGYDAVLVAGGDGTVNEAVSGMLAADGPPLPLGIIPLGTQNVLAQELGLPIGDLAATRQIIDTSRTRLIDVGRVSGPSETPRVFLLMAGFGFDAAVVGDTLRPIKNLLGPAAYALATVGALAKYQSTQVTLTLDGQEVRMRAYLVVVANAASYAYRQIKMAPFAALDDGWLDVCVFERAPLDRVGFAGQLVSVLTRRHLHDPRVRYYRAKTITLASDPPVSGQLDGDGIGETPVTITLLPRALPVLVG